MKAKTINRRRLPILTHWIWLCQLFTLSEMYTIKMDNLRFTFKLAYKLMNYTTQIKTIDVKLLYSFYLLVNYKLITNYFHSRWSWMMSLYEYIFHQLLKWVWHFSEFNKCELFYLTFTKSKSNWWHKRLSIQCL